ncbi:hypothetical protein BDR26DRAFT_863308 [Obelidium mucronatum]|nr:hypothetical protein BDR26DRAFT_863308 [Obelidium mucronatum]
MTTRDGRHWYESNNVLVRINPVPASAATRNTLLLSAHYDTQTVAKGVVDNGIAVAVALELIRTLIYNPLLSHPLIINFNNGEELFLLGAGAFTLHPWFPAITGFINLDGTGAAPGTRSMLFRTNSFDLLKQWKLWTPFPHASIVFNDFVSQVPSDTDYRVYVAFGHLQGVDIAFYSYRYQYHTPDDSTEFSWPISVQHLGDNVRAAVIGICNSNVLDTLAPDTAEIENPITSKLPIPDFVYYDLFSHLFVSSGASFRLVVISIVATSCVWGVAKSAKEIYMLGGHKRFFLRFFQPTFESYALVILSTMSCLVGTLVLSRFKSFINPGSSYGLPILNMIWIAFWIFGCFAMVPKIWPRISEALLLRSRTPTTRRSRRRRTRVNTPTPRGVPLQSAMQVSNGPPLEKWLPYGLLAFWITLLLPAYYFSRRGINALFFVTHWSFYSLLAVGFTQLLSPIALKWWRQQRSADISPSNSPTTVERVNSQWHSQVIKFYEKQIWGVQLLLSSLAPALLTIDIIEQFLIGAPACIAKTFSETTNDCLFGCLFILLFVNLLPAFQMARKTRLAELVLGVLFVPVFFYSVFVFPLSRNQPQQFSFAQNWNITTLESSITSDVEITFRHGAVIRFSKIAPQFEPIAKLTQTDLSCDFVGNTCRFRNLRREYLPTLSPAAAAAAVVKGDPRDVPALIDISIKNSTVVEGVKVVNGEFKGLPGSRVCSLGATFVDEEENSQTLDNTISIVIDPIIRNDGESQSSKDSVDSRWLIEGSGKRVGKDDGLLGSSEVFVLRREFMGPDGSNEKDTGMVVPFLLRFADSQNKRQRVKLTVACHWMEEERGVKFWKTLQSELPEWMIFGPGKFGGVRTFKTEVVSL